ncbi:hypothetical protein PUNSTDRAFT_94490 [Punctularia strigosozonata HHB-11173 SS5]|uniref:uncharacterized protein n=1 Tax=Punctularia strigosozonata (strain HHB-11173) TaxID=741275 RepID=UPI00044170F4|nr:uncharacterized protein PUNSTDRAFT_94490 [Punctularia strigosozonata HHB-11173 SS5]EIN13437.1 hypothetical protein PUNSTDRAFT_94490 [Punctularia strigosozonata HHB-11173 SS5]
MRTSVFVALALSLAVSARPHQRRATPQQIQNGKDAAALNTKFASFKVGDACTVDACIGSQFAPCSQGKLVAQDCAPTTKCAALPNVNSAGTSIACTTQADIDARFAAASDPDATAASTTDAAASSTSAAAASTDTAAATVDNAAGSTDIQSSLTLDPSVVATGFANDGQDVPAAGQVASLTSTNNFINFCAGQTITNGKQITTGSCNPAPMGQLPATTAMPSCKFVFPPNGDASLKANQAFTIKLAINNLETGHFVNAQENYFAAPQQLNAAGQIQGHSHVVVEQLDSLGQTTPTDPTKFAFFKGLNDAAVNGVLSVDVTGGLPAGAYKVSTINSAANHQPALVPIAQHGSLDDAVYFTIN